MAGHSSALRWGPGSSVRGRPGDPRLPQPWTPRSALEPGARGGGGSRDRPGPDTPRGPLVDPPHPHAPAARSPRLPEPACWSPALCLLSAAGLHQLLKPQDRAMCPGTWQLRGPVSGQLLAVGGALVCCLLCILALPSGVSHGPAAPSESHAHRQAQKRVNDLRPSQLQRDRASSAARRGRPQRKVHAGDLRIPALRPPSPRQVCVQRPRAQASGSDSRAAPVDPGAFSSSAGRGHCQASGPPLATA